MSARPRLISLARRVLLLGLCLVAVVGGQNVADSYKVASQSADLAAARSSAEGLSVLRRPEARPVGQEVGDGRRPIQELRQLRVDDSGYGLDTEGGAGRGSDSSLSGGAEAAAGGWHITRYGDGRLRADGSREPDYSGLRMGCPGAGRYDPARADIIARGPDSPFACGVRLQVCYRPPPGLAGEEGEVLSGLRCISGVVMDYGPGLCPTCLDLTECSMAILAGLDPTLDIQGRCVGEHFPTADYLEVSVERLEP